MAARSCWAVAVRRSLVKPCFPSASLRHEPFLGSSSASHQVLLAARLWCRARQAPALCTVGRAPLQWLERQSGAVGGIANVRGRLASTDASARSESGDLGRVIYVGPLSRMIRTVKIFSLSTSILGLCFQPMVLFSASETELSLKLAVATFLGLFIFCTPLALHFVTKKYVTRLHYNDRSKAFTAVTLSLLLREKRTAFTPADVDHSELGGAFDTMKIKGVPFFIDGNMVTDRQAYVTLMSYDKPMDLKITPADVEEALKGKTRPS